MKKILSVILVACLLFASVSLFASAAVTPTDAGPATPTDAGDEPGNGDPLPAGTKVCSSVADIAKFILEPSPWCEIQITPAVLTTKDGAQDVYLVALRGTGFSMNKSNNVLACFLSAFNLTSKYYTITRDYVYQYVPEGSRIVFAGHSLGGMIEQQLSCNDAFTAKYEILNTLNVGSPYVLTNSSKREGKLVRCVDMYDVIPMMGPGALIDFGNFSKVVKKDAGFLGDPDGAHNLSYMDTGVWGSYDVLGVQNGGAVLTFSTSDVASLHA